MLQASTPTYDQQHEFVCACCHAPVCAADVQYGQPLITARQLISLTAITAFRAPKLLGDILLKELPPAPYCAPCRQKLPAKRQAEQLKFMLGVLLLLAVVTAGILYLQAAF
jgi:hypothetical protein